MSAFSAAHPTIPGEALDHYLGLGYYRMQQELFTCQFVPFGEELYTAHWLRLVLGRVHWGPAQRRLLRRNAGLAATVRPFRPFRPTAEYENLYARYRAAVTFDAADTLSDVLLGEADYNIFTTNIIELRDGGQLVGAGVFDQGQQTTAGIVNFYDPAYQRRSLGKYLLLLTAEYARQAGLAYYYPGYVIQGYPKFDYKLFACPAATEVFDCVRERWQPFSWEEVAAHSAELLADWLPGEWAGNAG